MWSSACRGPSGPIEELGDRDPGGAPRPAAILQALIAREPAEARPSIQGLAARTASCRAGHGRQ